MLPSELTSNKRRTKLERSKSQSINQVPRYPILRMKANFVIKQRENRKRDAGKRSSR